MTTDYCALTRQLMDQLRVEGLVGEASSLLQVMESGATGTEILMGLRWHLKQMRHASVSQKSADMIDTLIRELDGALGP